MILNSRHTYRILKPGLALVLLASLCSTAKADSPQALIKEGNRAYANAKYDEALSAYEKASVEAPESSEILFNKGASHYQKGEFNTAAELFNETASKTKDPVFESNAKFNQGNALFRESERLRDSDLKKSLKSLEQSIVLYQKALELSPEFKDAAHNIEVARLLIKQILDEIKKKEEEEKKKQQEEKQDQRDKTCNNPSEQESGKQDESNEQQKQDSKQGQEQKEQEQQKQQQAGTAEQQKQEQQAAMAKDEAAHDILDEEQENREERELRTVGGYQAVDKDW